MAEITEIGEIRLASEGQFAPYSYDKKYLLIEIDDAEVPGEGDTTARIETNGIYGTEYEELLDAVLLNLLGH